MSMKGLLKDFFTPLPRSLAPPPAVSPPTCPNCNDMPVLPNPATGGQFDYCSRTCATQAKNISSNQRQGQSGTLCEQCKRRQKFKAGTNVYRYCGRTCARLAANSRLSQAMTSPVNPLSPTYPASPWLASPGRTCRIHWCTGSVFVHHDGTPGDYCTMTHKKWGEHGCISCRAAPGSGASILCQSCYDNELRRAPAIVQVPVDHNRYKSVESQFKKSWRQGTPCPEVQAVYKVVVTEESQKRYKLYLDGVEARRNFAAKSKSRGNENRRWHGTVRKCKLGDPGNTTFCADAGCFLCSILKTSFNMAVSTQGWFGRGIYTSSTSSNSNGYSRNQGVSSDLKALLLNKVVVGNGKKLTQIDTTIVGPPAGYDSVLAEAAPGGSLIHDELIVYSNDAARPSYLVMYKSL
ncbi:hypothetical protein BJ322DRAFT_395524 [Thelephora terrestris]|uniref:PARP catalytic domain-containing protein n=1 Tax=Thelephora terrestris TaxID=56493 RepID=A0A9P6HMT3_9AGAM|nr:hypothetical protein BJ322DRAFT_395524 [Thelephora terrestris]